MEGRQLISEITLMNECGLLFLDVLDVKWVSCALDVDRTFQLLFFCWDWVVCGI